MSLASWGWSSVSSNPNLEEYFCEIPQLGGNLFHFFSLFRHHTYETFVEIIEILTKYEPELHINVEAR